MVSKNIDAKAKMFRMQRKLCRVKSLQQGNEYSATEWGTLRDRSP